MKNSLSQNEPYKTGSDSPWELESYPIISPKSNAAGISLVFLGIGILWVVLVNYFMHHVMHRETIDPDFQIFQEVFRIILTSGILYYFLYHNFNKIRLMSVEITESHMRSQEAEAKIYHLAYYDTLTGLPNRVRLEEDFLQYQKSFKKMALLYFDLDNFKVVNDTLGHVHGDTLLKDISQVLTGIRGENDVLARLGGDEFALLMVLEDAPITPDVQAKNIIRILEDHWVIGNQEFYLSASVGIALYPEHGDTYQQLLKNADTAMYAAKAKGKSCIEVFEKSMADKILESTETEKSLRYGIRNKEFVLHYQPQYNLKTGEITGVEALIRWNHPFKGMVYPKHFIDVAEKTGLIREIGRWVIHEACRQCREWEETGFSPVIVSVNLSAMQLKDKQFIDDIKKIIAETGVNPGSIQFEITEHAAIDNFDKIIFILTQLRAMGFKISLDDFGTGYSSLNYLKLLPIDSIKIDRSFVENVTANSKEQAITKSLIQLAQEMDLKVIAEGIETEEQRCFLRDIECDEGQGFLFGMAIPGKEVEQKLKKKMLAG